MIHSHLSKTTHGEETDFKLTKYIKLVSVEWASSTPPFNTHSHPVAPWAGCQQATT